jgi:hypothetical protein
MSYLSEAQQYGSVSAAEASVSAYGQSSASGAGVPVIPASGSGGSNQGSANTVVGGSVYTSDSAWATAAQAGLSDIGYSATDVATALGLYLTGQPVDSTQANLINAAIAEFGAPPQGTFQIITKPASAPSPVTGTVTVPNITGDDVVNASSALQSAGLLMTPNPAAVKGKVHIVTGQNPKAGSKVAHGSTVHITYKTG